MKQSVKTLVDSIEKEIRIILDNAEHSQNYYSTHFDFGIINYNLEINDEWDKWEEERKNEVTLYINYVDVLNENCKVLTNLSTEVFNQLETNYTNY